MEVHQLVTLVKAAVELEILMELLIPAVELEETVVQEALVSL